MNKELADFFQWMEDHTKGEYEATQPLTPFYLNMYYRMYTNRFFKEDKRNG